MDVLERAREGEPAALDLGAHGLEALVDGVAVIRRNDAACRQHVAVHQRALDVLGRQAPIDADRLVDRLHERVGRRGKAPAPHKIRLFLLRFSWFFRHDGLASRGIGRAILCARRARGTPKS